MCLWVIPREGFFFPACSLFLPHLCAYSAAFVQVSATPRLPWRTKGISYLAFASQGRVYRTGGIHHINSCYLSPQLAFQELNLGSQKEKLYKGKGVWFSQQQWVLVSLHYLTKGRKLSWTTAIFPLFVCAAGVVNKGWAHFPLSLCVYSGRAMELTEVWSLIPTGYMPSL